VDQFPFRAFRAFRGCPPILLHQRRALATLIQLKPAGKKADSICIVTSRLPAAAAMAFRTPASKTFVSKQRRTREQFYEHTTHVC
jgi:hypothetical protein